jgi:hypothetical protein
MIDSVQRMCLAQIGQTSFCGPKGQESKASSSFNRPYGSDRVYALTPG